MNSYEKNSMTNCVMTSKMRLGDFVFVIND